MTSAEPGRPRPDQEHAPLEDAELESDAARVVEFARFTNRFLALLLDADYFMLLAMVPAILGGFSSPPAVSSLAGVWALVVHWAYFALAESAEGHALTWWEQATWGKYLYRLRVVTITGEPLSAIRATVRYVVKFVSLLTCVGVLISIAMIVFTRRKQALHDWICETMVVNAPISDDAA